MHSAAILGEHLSHNRTVKRLNESKDDRPYHEFFARELRREALKYSLNDRMAARRKLFEEHAARKARQTESVEKPTPVAVRTFQIDGFAVTVVNDGFGFKVSVSNGGMTASMNSEQVKALGIPGLYSTKVSSTCEQKEQDDTEDEEDDSDLDMLSEYSETDDQSLEEISVDCSSDASAVESACIQKYIATASASAFEASEFNVNDGRSRFVTNLVVMMSDHVGLEILAAFLLAAFAAKMFPVLGV